MATLQKLRNKGGVLIATVIGLSLVAFILSDFLNSGETLFSQSENVVGEIAGESITYPDYMTLVNKIEENQKANSRQSSIPEAQMEQIREYAWRMLVEKNTVEKEIVKVGVSVSPDELFDLVQGNNPSPLIRQYFTDPKTGMFDRNAVINFLKNMDSNPESRQAWLNLEQEIKKGRLREKYETLISKGLYITNFQAKDMTNAMATKVSFSYIGKAYNAITDTSVAVTEKELKNYYNDHEKNFEQTASRDIDYLVFQILPSKEDVVKTEELINKLASEFKVAEDAKQYAMLNSKNNVESIYFKKSDLTEQVGNFAFSATKADMLGPIFENNAYTLYRISDVKMLADSVKARHILIAAKQTPEATKALADSIANAARKGGDFAELAKKFSTDQGSADNGGDLGWFREGMMVKPFNDACFNTNKGSIVTVETQFGTHIIQVLEKSPEVKKVQLATVAVEVVPSNQTYQSIYTEASQFIAEYNTFDKFEKASNTPKFSQKKRVANNLKEGDKTIAGLEKPREVVRWAFKAEKGDVSTVFELNGQFVVATLTGLKEEGIAPFESVRNDVEFIVKKEKKGEILAKQLAEAASGASTIEAIASKMGLSQMEADNISFSSYVVPGAGIEPKLIAASTVTAKNTISKPVIGINAVYLFNVKDIAKDSTLNAADNQKRLMQMYGNFAPRAAEQAIEDAANIKDKRSKFF